MTVAERQLHEHRRYAQLRRKAKNREYNTRAFIALALVLAWYDVATAAFNFFILPNFEFNTTSSMPYGLYARRPVDGDVKDGQIVSWCNSMDAIRRGLSIEMIIPKGACASGYAPFIKRVIAAPGDVIDNRGELLRVNGHEMQGTTLLDDSRVGILRTVKPGVHKMRSGEAWVISEELKGYDSRYYGAIKPAWIMTPWWTWRNR
jgi:conjugative transfer signal peptidase TraF